MSRAMRLTTSQLVEVDARDHAMALGLGWHTERRADGSLIYWHNGASDGFNAVMAIDLENQLAAFLVTNQLKTDASGNVEHRLTKAGLDLVLAR